MIKHPLVKPFMILLLGLLAYSNSFSGPFLFDDHYSIMNNPSILQLWPIWEAFDAPNGFITDRRPIANFSLAINYAISGYDTWSYHAFNLTIHLLNGLLLYVVLLMTLNLLKQDTIWKKNGQWPAFYIALIWTVHPLLTECVTYISTRTESLASFFYLLIFYCFIQSIKTNSFFWKTSTVLSCIMGMGCKEILVTAPFLLLLYDRTFITGSLLESLKKRKLLYLSMLSSWLIPLYYSEHWGSIVNLDSNDILIENKLTFFTNLLAQCGFLLHYIKLIFYPNPLVVHYGALPIPQNLSNCWPQVMMIIFLFIISIVSYKRFPKFCFLSLGFFILLAPTTLIPMPYEVIAERRVYLASIFILILAASCYLKIANFYLGSSQKVHTLTIFITCCITLIFTLMTWKRNTDYQNEIDFYKSILKHRPQNYRVHNALGNALVQKNKINEAKNCYLMSTNIQPKFGEAWIGLGNIYYNTNQLDKAWKSFSQATEWKYYPARAFFGLGNILLKKQLYAEAELQYKKALDLNYKSRLLYLKYAEVLYKQKKFAESDKYLKAADSLPHNDLQYNQPKGINN